jgi:hypothetical protein
MQTLSISYWWVLFGFIALSLIMMFIFWILSVGKEYLQAKLKSKFFPYKFKGAWVTYTKKDGRYYLFYLLISRDKEIKLFGDKQKLGECENTLIDIVNEMLFDKEGKTVPTKTFYQGEPIYHLVEGSPTNILIKSRDYEQDISKLKEILKIITETVNSKDVEQATKLKNKLNQIFLQLYTTEFKYLPSARKLVINLLNLESFAKSQVDDEGNSLYPNIDDLQIISKYREIILELIKVLTVKDKTLVNYDELFANGNLSKIYNQSGHLQYIAGVLKNLKLRNLDKIMWGVIIIAVLGFLVVGNMVRNQDKKLDVISNQINELSNQLEKDMNVLQSNVSVNFNPEHTQNFPIVGNNG